MIFVLIVSVGFLAGDRSCVYGSVDSLWNSSSVHIMSDRNTDGFAWFKPTDANVFATATNHDSTSHMALRQARGTVATMMKANESRVYFVNPENCTGTPLTFDTAHVTVIFDKSRVLKATSSLECQWTVVAPSGFKVTVSFQRRGS